MKFKYQARNQAGEMQVGFVEAGSRDGAVGILATHSLFVLTVEPVGGQSTLDRINAFLNRVKRRDMAIFARQLATLLSVRIPLNNALKILEQQTQNKTLKEAILEVAEDIDGGLSFSQAMERQGAVFPPFYVEMVRAAEVTGNLDDVAGFLADYTEKEGDLVSKAAGALIYPSIVFALFIVVAFILVTFVFPSIGQVFTENNVSFPWYTQLLLSTGKFMSKWWVVVVAFVGLLGFSVENYFSTDEGRATLDEAKLRLPVAKKVFLPIIMARFGNAAALLTSGGIPITQSLEIISLMVGNVLYKDVIHEIAEDVRQGKLLSESIASHPGFFPPLVAQMVGVGETAGKIEEMFRRISNIYTREADQMTGNLTELIQPILMIGMGLMVGVLFASILIPIYNLTANIH